ncbi:23S rRNA (adenine(2030)-N(6))-methyltransferase RlmJ [Alteromonas sp. BL110]|uniref:23S rRNA (adenine(2030)-N(6))-methyltransferase RlmJ n=1 Tax=Alteromonas sp. BL110 TaxID=1714845 RepID=UPI000E47EA02|nr:23S rRNA (adenine(2030)-N(6))-methyltransferase RlmJ [Alteromonas sp. BL110]AXT40340.1 23S rRNA (adenine(2030)-N(6))-methyltransferase RlmJ [Alteromonas sp. BL110]RKM79572.1 23S rRNA (adenine(2030)-N(6))-methyltransferase RlmJ [Alteromonas sp. BL110]
MLSYQHAFHAGNHADVIKHLCWIGVINALKKKDKPFTLFDTHAGAGTYDLTDDLSSKNKEYESGISRLFGQADGTATPESLALENQAPKKQSTENLPSLLNDYLSLCEPFLAQQQYPGSPAISAMAKRGSDNLHLMELHPGEFQKLEKNVSRLRTDNSHVHKRDGYEGLRALTPPKPNRGAILIDPPYERASEYSDLVKGVNQVLKRWQQAQIVVWYPLLSERAGAKSGASEVMCDKLAELGKPCFKAEICVAENTSNAGMYGSGVFVLNPPWQLDTNLGSALTKVVGMLGKCESGFQASAHVTWVNEDT